MNIFSRYKKPGGYIFMSKYCKEVYVIGGAKQAGGAIPATKEGLEVGLKL